MRHSRPRRSRATPWRRDTRSPARAAVDARSSRRSERSDALRCHPAGASAATPALSSRRSERSDALRCHPAGASAATPCAVIPQERAQRRPALSSRRSERSERVSGSTRSCAGAGPAARTVAPDTRSRRPSLRDDVSRHASRRTLLPSTAIPPAAASASAAPIENAAGAPAWSHTKPNSSDAGSAAEPDRQVVPAERRAAALAAHEVGHQRALGPLGEPEEDAVHAEQRPRLPRAVGAREPEVHGGVEQPPRDQRRPAADAVGQRAARRARQRSSPRAAPPRGSARAPPARRAGSRAGAGRRRWSCRA